MNIKTSQVTQGAMYCALYGVLLFINQQFGLIIEINLPLLFSFPILVCSAKNDKNISWIVAMTMALMTFLFGTFTTWFYSWTSILIGFVYGMGIHKKWPMMRNFFACTLLSVISNFFTVFVWAKLFDMELSADFAMFESYLPNITLTTFMAMFVLVLGVLEGLSLHFMAILLLRKLRIQMVKMKSIMEIKSPAYWGFSFICTSLLCYLAINVLECSQEVIGLIQIVLLINYFVLDFYGAIVMLNLCLIHNRRKLSFFATLGAMIPVIQWIWVAMGLLDCLFQIRKKIFYKRIVL